MSFSTPLAFPALAGVWTIRGDRLACRLPRRIVDVDAPAEVLEGLTRACDGSRDWQTAVDAMSGAWSSASVESALRALAANGALVDVSPRSRAVGDRPFDEHRASRQTPCTFGARALDARGLSGLFRALLDVALHEGRGVSRHSGDSADGCDATKWYVALLQGNEVEEAGLYKLRRPSASAGSGGVSLQRLPGVATAAWGCLVHPSILAHATALILPVVRLDELGSSRDERALASAFVEIAHACQRSADACEAADATSAFCNEILHEEVRRLFALSDAHEPLPAWVVGSRPSEADSRLANRVEKAFRLRMHPRVGGAIELATSVASAGPLRTGKRSPNDLTAAGRDADPKLAAVKAEAEAWERLGWATPRPLETASMAELDDAVDPRTLFRYSEAQHRRPGFAFRRFAARRPVGWVAGIDLQTGRRVHLPAQCVHPVNALPPREAEQPYGNASTSGVAAWTTREMAIERALAELVERDAFARAWLAQRALPDVPHEVLSSTLRQRAGQLETAGYDVSVRVLPSHWLPCTIVVARQAGRAFTCAATGAGECLDDAVNRAMCEVESKIQAGHGQLLLADLEPSRVRSHRDHGNWYRTRRGHAHVEALLAGPCSRPVPTPRAGIPLAERLRESGLRTFACELTPPGASLAQGRRPLHVWRAFVPGLVPLWFGYGYEPWGSIADAGVPVDRSALRRRPIHPCT